MKIGCIWEHNGQDTILYARELPGAYARGTSREEALEKMHGEARSWFKWMKGTAPETFEFSIVQEKECDLEIRDADSDVLFDSETGALSSEEYEALKSAALKSAADFLALYMAVPDRDASCLPERKTFYGKVPRTAREMYEHTKNVNSYYFGEIDVDADNDGDILEIRRRGFESLEKREGFLQNEAVEGSYGEMWTLKKVLRRFIWHDRIHARAMYRMCVNTFGKGAIENIFMFER